MTAITKPFLQLCMALTLALGLMLPAAQPAEAGRKGRVAAGLVLGVIGGVIIADEIRRRKRHRRARRNRHNFTSPRPRRHRYQTVQCYRGPEQCRWVGRRECWYNRYDERVCTGGRYKCWRERICN